MLLIIDIVFINFFIMKKRILPLICVVLSMTFLTIANFEKSSATTPAPEPAIWDWPQVVYCSFIFNGVEVFGKKVDCLSYPILSFCWPGDCIAHISGDPIGG